MKTQPARLLLSLLLFSFLLTALSGQAGPNPLSVQYEELTAPEFIQAIQQSGGICLLPAGIMEKHGPHLPLGTDLFLSREIALRGAHKEYSLVFPPYYFGQIFEARHQPGTVAYSPELVWNILEETCEELSRNGVKKIIIVNGHGGNTHFFSYFCQSQLARETDYQVYLFTPDDGEVGDEIAALRTTDYGGHADEVETSMMVATRPDLVKAERGGTQSGRDRQRLQDLPFAYTGIWWYASYPNHYAGDGSTPNKEIGELSLESDSDQLAELIRYLKANDPVGTLQEQFHREAKDPLKTGQ
ncbi:MAG: creatininase family protein [Bacteroidales bacterium]